MTRKFSLAHLTVLGCPPPEMTRMAAEIGYDFVSFRLVPLGTPGEPVYDLARDKPLMRQTKAALAATGLGVSDGELARILDGVDPATYLPAMEAAAELGATGFVTSAWTPDRNFVIDCYCRLCEMAKPLGLTMDFEFVPFASITSLKETVDLLRDANQTNCGVLIDTLHFHRSHVSLDELDAVPREWLHFAHVCDAADPIPTSRDELVRTTREERLYVGEGSIDIAAILNHMPDIRCSVELPHAKRAEELGYFEHARRCLQTTKDYLDSASQPLMPESQLGK